MKKIFITLSFIVLSFSVSAQEVIPLWGKGSVPAHHSTITQEESVPDQAGRISHVSNPSIKVFLPPKNVKSSGKAVVICPGGGYWLVTTYNEGDDYARWLAENGIVGITLKYRMPNGVHQLPLEDLARAIQLTEDNASAWGVDRSKIGVMGFSAGGHLAATGATMLQRRPDFSILYYPVISMREGITHEGSRQCLFGNMPLRDYYSAELRVDTLTPAAFMVHSVDDGVVDISNSYLYAKALREKSIPCELLVYEKGGHGWGFNENDFYKQLEVREKLLRWINNL